MSFTLLMSPFLEPLLGDQEVNKLFSPMKDIEAIFAFELELANAQEKCGVIPKGVAKAISAQLVKLKPDPDHLAKAIARDGVIVPYVVTLLKTAVGSKFAEHVHFLSTSQDVIDTSLVMRMSEACDAMEEHLLVVQDRLQALRKSHGKRPLMGRTRMQQALPIMVSDRLDSWENNVASPAIGMSQLAFPLQLFGPVGTYRDQKVREIMAMAMNLQAPSRSWQNDRSLIRAYGNYCAEVTGAFGKIGADICLMSQNELSEIKLAGGGGSSAMPHKQNPVKAEMLVTLARFNASLVSGLHNAAVHEQERSGAAWTLEWLILPQMICAAAGACRVARELLESVESIGA